MCSEISLFSSTRLIHWECKVTCLVLSPPQDRETSASRCCRAVGGAAAGQRWLAEQISIQPARLSQAAKWVESFLQASLLKGGEPADGPRWAESSVGPLAGNSERLQSAKEPTAGGAHGGSPAKPTSENLRKPQQAKGQKHGGSDRHVPPLTSSGQIGTGMGVLVKRGYSGFGLRPVWVSGAAITGLSLKVSGSW